MRTIFINVITLFFSSGDLILNDGCIKVRYTCIGAPICYSPFSITISVYHTLANLYGEIHHSLLKRP